MPLRWWLPPDHPDSSGRCPLPDGNHHPHLIQLGSAQYQMHQALMSPIMEALHHRTGTAGTTASQSPEDNHYAASHAEMLEGSPVNGLPPDTDPSALGVAWGAVYTATVPLPSADTTIWK